MNVEIANKLVNLRKEHHLSQENLAEKIGVSRQAVSKWERSESSPDTDNLIALSKIYHISIDEMLDSKINAKKSEEIPKEEEPINTEDSYIEDDQTDNQEEGILKNNTKTSHVALFATIIFFILGFAFNLWHPAWLVFVAIPIFHFFVPSNVQTRNNKTANGWAAFPYPIFAFILFIIIGMVFDGFAYSWLIFLTIPIWAHFVKEK